MTAWLLILRISHWTKEKEIKAHLSSFKIVKILVICLYLELRELVYKWPQIDLSKHPEVASFLAKDLAWHSHSACQVCGSLAVIFPGFSSSLGYKIMSSALSSSQTIWHRLSWYTVTLFLCSNSSKSST